MARAGLGWTLDDLAKCSGVNRRSILNFENGGSITAASCEKVCSALQAAGVVFIDRGAYVGGVVPPMEGR